MQLLSVILMGVLCFLLGASIFSFLNVIICRLPKKESFVKGHSHCTACGTELKARDLVPVFSWLCLRGKCRYCGAPISGRETLLEIFGGAAAVICFFRSLQTPMAGLTGYLLLCALTVAAMVDLNTMEIPDGCHIFIALLAVVRAFTVPGVSIPGRLSGAVCVSVPMLLLALVINGAFGGGDIKLMAACGLFLGWKLVLPAFFLGAVIGGIQGVVLLAGKKAERKTRFAFGPGLCAGVLLSLLFGNAMIAGYLSLFGL